MQWHDGELTADEQDYFAGSDDEGWDTETGKPGVVLFANALQVWSALQTGDVTVRSAATAFNVAPAMVVAAVKSHAWMFLTGPRDDYDRLKIEHEGE
mgnify:CR=1 FL=1